MLYHTRLIKWLQGALFREVKGQGNEADHSPPTSDRERKRGLTCPLPFTSLWRRASSRETHHVSTRELNRFMLLRKPSLIAVRTTRNAKIYGVRSPYLTGNITSSQNPIDYCCLGKQSLFTMTTARNTDTLYGQSVPHRKHITSPLQSPTG
jgi:hypothetical protein